MVDRMDSSQERIETLIGHLAAANRPKTDREALVSYMTHIITNASDHHFNMLRGTLMHMVQQHGMWDTCAVPQPGPSTHPQPSTSSYTAPPHTTSHAPFPELVATPTRTLPGSTPRSSTQTSSSMTHLSPTTLLNEFQMPGSWQTLAGEDPNTSLTDLTHSTPEGVTELGGLVRTSIGEDWPVKR